MAKLKKIVLFNYYFESVVIPIDDVDYLDIIGATPRVSFRNFWDFNEESGRYKKKVFRDYFACKKLVLKLLKNNVEYESMKKILEMNNILFISLIFDDNTNHDYFVPRQWSSDEIPKNLCQKMVDSKDLIEIICE